MPSTLFAKSWQSHVAAELADAAALLYIDRHLVHEFSSPQTFRALCDAGRRLQPLADECQTFTVDLETRRTMVAGPPPFHFDVGDEQRLARLNGWDETDVILNLYSDDMAAFEQRHRLSQPWLFRGA